MLDYALHTCSPFFASTSIAQGAASGSSPPGAGAAFTLRKLDSGTYGERTITEAGGNRRRSKSSFSFDRPEAWTFNMEE